MGNGRHSTRLTLNCCKRESLVQRATKDKDYLTNPTAPVRFIKTDICRASRLQMADHGAPQSDSNIMLHIKNSEDVSMTDAVHNKHTLPKAVKKGHEISTRTIKNPPFSYVCLELISDGAAAAATAPLLDNLTVRSYLTSGLNQFLGLTGAAISVDILKVEDNECWIRVPREDLRAVIAATGQWIGTAEGNCKVGWRLKASGNWLGSLVGSQGLQNCWRG